MGTYCNKDVLLLTFFQSLSSEPVRLWLWFEVAGRLFTLQPDWDQRRTMLQSSTARQQTHQSDQEQEVPLFRWNTQTHVCSYLQRNYK